MVKAQTLNEQAAQDRVGLLDPVNGFAQELGLYMAERAGVSVWAVLDRNVENVDPTTGAVTMSAREAWAYVNPNSFDHAQLVVGDVAVINNIAYRIAEIERRNRRTWRLRLRMTEDVELEEHQYGTHPATNP